MVSEWMLGTFLRFLCYVFGTKLGGVLPLRISHKAMQLVLGSKIWQTWVKSWKVSVSVGFHKGALGTFLGFLCYVCVHEIRLCFAVADASQSHVAVLGRVAGCKMWQTCVKNWKSQFYSVLVGFFRSDVRQFFRVPLLRVGYEIRLCFAVAGASPSHVAFAWQARRRTVLFEVFCSTRRSSGGLQLYEVQQHSISFFVSIFVRFLCCLAVLLAAAFGLCFSCFYGFQKGR